MDFKRYCAQSLLALSLLPGLAIAQNLRTISVDPIADDDPDAGCNLREAIDIANAGLMEGVGCSSVSGGSGLPVNYQIELPAMSYVLTGSVDDNNLGGDLDVRATITLQGQGANETIIDGDRLDRVFHVIDSAASLSLRDLQVTGGWVARRENGGGVLVNEGTLELHRVTVQENQARGEVGALAVDGGGVANIGGTVRVINSEFLANTATFRGGAIFSDGTLTVESSTFINNQGNSGGGLYAFRGAIVVHSTLFSDNRADAHGGGLFLTGDGVGPSAVLAASAVVGNSAGIFGGGLSTWNFLDIANTTIALNRAEFSGGGVRAGLASIVSPVRLTHTTIFRNSAGQNGGGLDPGSSNALVANSIIADNTTDSGIDADCTSNVTSTGFNILSRNNGCPLQFPGGSPNANDDFVGTSTVPLDAKLAAFDGLLPLFEPLIDSVAVDRVPESDCRYQAGSGNPLFSDGQFVATDQRGAARTAPCDVGAVELTRLFADGFESP